MHLERFFTIVLVLTATAARGQSSKEANLLQALEHVESASSESIPPEIRETIINKPKIAEETLKRMKGLREAGNPHIQRGTGLLLPDMKDDPSVSQVDLQKLHDEREAMVERRSSLERMESSTSSVHRAEVSTSEAAAQSAPERRKNFMGLVIAGGSLLLTVAGALYYLKTQKG